jgi:hypothetical protein
MNCAKKLCLAAMLLAFSGSLFAADEPPPLPKDYDQALGDSGDSLWTRIEFRFRAPTDYFYQRLRAAGGEAETIPLPANFSAIVAAPVGNDLVAAGSPSVFPAKHDLPGEVVWYSPKEGTLRATPPLQRHLGEMLALTDGSVLLVGGRLTAGAVRTNAVERVRRTPKGLEIERLPDIPGPVRHGYALAALADGRAMVLGGSDYTYTGCGKCLADTYLLDPKTGTWSPGPKMLEPRADATATRLPDGSVLVAGGWTPGHDWNEEASRTSERWDPRHNAFVAGPALPIAVAMHKAQWAAGTQGRPLLLAGGMARAWESNDAVLAYDDAADQWRTVGENCRGDSKDGGRVQFGTRLHRGTLFAWCGAILYRERKESRLRTSALAIDAEGGYALRRGAAAFAGDGALLAAGGTLADTGTHSTAVDLFGTDGQLRALASLNHARYGARAVALPGGGYLVAGGVGGILHDRPGERPKLPMEWLPGNADPAQARWRDVEPWFSPQDAVTQEADGSLLAVSPAGSVERLRMEVKDGQLRAERTALPGLGRARESGEHGNQTAQVRVKSLPDGRIVAAGGLQRQRAVAVLDDASLDEDAVDSYAEIGEQEISRRYETYDPASQSWRSSAPAGSAGGPVTVLDDGRVVMVTPSRITGDQRPDGTWPASKGLLEISSADGRSWQPFEVAPLVKLDERVRPFVRQGELLLAGAAPKAGTDAPTLLQWYDAGNKRWITLWEAPARSNWREHQGRVILRELAGKRLLIPVEGL